jgi:hypothetical protein
MSMIVGLTDVGRAGAPAEEAVEAYGVPAGRRENLAAGAGIRPYLWRRTPTFDVDMVGYISTYTITIIYLS